MSVKALIFDVDGTLAETEEAHRRAFNEAFAAHGLDWHWSMEDYRDLLQTTGGKERMQAHRRAIGVCAPDDAAIAAIHAAKTARYGEILARGGLSLRPGIRETIEAGRAAGLKIAVATTTNRPNVEALARACFGAAADEIFDAIAAGDEVSAKKPAPDVFCLALKRLGLSGSEAVAFEDSLNGMRAARSAGLPVVITPSAYTAHEDFAAAEEVVTDLSRWTLPYPA